MNAVETPTVPPRAAADDVVRVTVTGRGRSADLTLPALVPLAEVLPGVVRTLGILEPDEVHGGYRLHTADGRALSLEENLLELEVPDGAVLSISVGVDEPPAKVYDDVVEAIADVVEDQAGSWTPRSSRHTMLAVAAVLALLAAWTLHTARIDPVVTTAVAGGLALVMTLAGAVVAKVRSDVAGALVLLGIAVAFVLVAATGGAVAAPGPAAMAAGLGSAGVGAVGLAVLGHRGWPLLPAVTVGVAGAVVGGLMGATGLSAGSVLLVLLVLLVLAAGLVPRYAVQLTRTAPPPVQSEAAILTDPEPIDPGEVRRRVEVSAGLVHGLRLTVVVLHVLAAPVVAVMNPLALVVTWLVSAVVVLGARRDARVVDIVVSVAGAVLAVVTATVGAVVAHPGWGPALTTAVAVAAVAVLLALAFPPRSQLAPARVLDVVESVVLVLLIPLTVLALGVIPFP